MLWAAAPPSPLPTIPGHVPINVCNYCRQILPPAPSDTPAPVIVGHTGIDTIVVVSAIIANICIVLGFLAAWIRHRNRVVARLKQMQVRVAQAEANHDDSGHEAVIVYLRIGHWALVKLPMKVTVDLRTELQSERE